MNRNLHTHSALSAFILATAFAVGAAYAQVDNPPKSSTATPESHEHQHTMATMGDTSKMSGMHDMPATVTSVDQKTGIVAVESEGMKLKVHFPSSAIADLKKGDKISLHLGFTKQ